MNCFVLVALTAVISASSVSCLVAQETRPNIPEPALRELLAYVVRSETKPTPRSQNAGRPIAFAVVGERFGDKSGASEAARSAGFAVYQSREQILQCSNNAPPTCNFATGDRVADIRDAIADGDALIVRIIVSSFVRKENGQGRLFGVLREVTLSRTGGRWQVQGDQVLLRS